MKFSKLNAVKRNATCVVMLMGIAASAPWAGAQQTPKDWQSTVAPNAAQARKGWQQLTTGEELAHGKKVKFFPKPNYAPTTDENDQYDLTDGTLSSRSDDRIWVSKDAVGWYGDRKPGGMSAGMLLLVDLGSPQPIGQIAIRVLGGHQQISLDLPAGIEFLASDDGKQFHRLQYLHYMPGVNPAEASKADLKSGYFFPQDGKPYMVPLVCRTAVRARFIAMRVWSQNSLYTDQISILKAEDESSVKGVDAFPKAQVYTDGLAVMPRHKPMVITTNIATPNWLFLLDNSGVDFTKNDGGFRLELPKGVRILTNVGLSCKEVTGTDPHTNVYQYHYDGKNRYNSIGPLWITKDAGAIIPANATVKITGIIGGVDSHTTVTPLKFVDIPQSPVIKGLDISLTWTHDPQQRVWPNFLKDFHKMGFGYVATFPYYFPKDEEGNWTDEVQKNLAFLQEARKQGYKVVSNGSPFGIMWQKIQADQKAGKIDDAEARELFSQVDGKRGHQVNLLYRGKYFQEAVDRIAKLTALVQPDQLYLDIEWWAPVVAEARKDPRAIAAWKQSGKSWDDFVTDLGTEVLGTVVKKVRAAVPNRQIEIGLYNSDPGKNIEESFFQWDKIYPGILDIAMPSVYVQGRAEDVAKRISYDYGKMHSRNIIPWLSPGAEGEYDPEFVEPTVLESILNGAKGVTYYWFGDFDPMDFYYHAKAMKALSPFQTLLQKGHPVDYKGDNPDMHYTCFASGNEALLLVSNYRGTANTKVKLPVIFTDNAKVTIAGEGYVPIQNNVNTKMKLPVITVDRATVPVQDNSVVVDVPAGEFRLIYMESK
jgi:hypothetical protein